MRYADPSLCPGCRSVLPPGATTCRSCGLLVRHPIAVDLFHALQRADALLEQLRGSAVAAPPRPAPLSVASGSPLPPPLPRPDGRRGVRLASVPKILLGLGALCLLVAAVTFLAVSWSSLGFGARTAVLVGLTVGAGAAALWLNRHDLRIAAEALITVALGLLVLDVFGAEAAGWLGHPSDPTLAIVLGLVVTVAGTAAALPRPDGGHRLAAPQIAAGLGYLTTYVGALDATGSELTVGHVTVAAGAGLAWLFRDRLQVLSWSLLAVAGCVWTVSLAAALLLAQEDPSLEGMWLDGSGWSLLASAAALLLPGLMLRRHGLLVAGGSIAALLATTAVTVPAADEGTTVIGAVALLATAAWTVGYRLLPAPASPIALGPAAVGSLILAVLGLVTCGIAAARVGNLPDGSSPGVRPWSPDPVTEPLLAVPSAIVVVAFLGLAARATGAPASPWWYGGTVVAGLAGVVTLASYDVPLVLVVVALGLVAALAIAAALLDRRSPHTGLGLTAIGVAAVGVPAALPSAALTTAAAGVALTVAAAAHLLGRTGDVRLVGGLALAPALGVAIWSSGVALDVEVAWLGVPLLLVVGLLALARPRLEVELPVVAVAVLGTPSAVLAAADTGGSLALHLTLAGFLLSATALLNKTRRHVAWAGAALLFLATWVRLGDLGVTAPEPYALPLAVVLTALGVVHLRRHPDAATATALVPGLMLGTVPSLLWALHDPFSLRALLLGVACLSLTVAGATLRWSAPLLVGSAVGAALVVREIGPYAGAIPQWVWIGLAGALLTTLGITWERRLLELRRAVGLLGRLR